MKDQNLSEDELMVARLINGEATEDEWLELRTRMEQDDSLRLHLQQTYKELDQATDLVALAASFSQSDSPKGAKPRFAPKVSTLVLAAVAILTVFFAIWWFLPSTPATFDAYVVTDQDDVLVTRNGRTLQLRTGTGLHQGDVVAPTAGITFIRDIEGMTEVTPSETFVVSSWEDSLPKIRGNASAISLASMLVSILRENLPTARNSDPNLFCPGSTTSILNPVFAWSSQLSNVILALKQGETVIASSSGESPWIAPNLQPGQGYSWSLSETVTKAVLLTGEIILDDSATPIPEADIETIQRASMLLGSASADIIDNASDALGLLLSLSPPLATSPLARRMKAEAYARLQLFDEVVNELSNL